jgi:hypothetical protein
MIVAGVVFFEIMNPSLCSFLPEKIIIWAAMAVLRRQDMWDEFGRGITSTTETLGLFHLAKLLYGMVVYHKPLGVAFALLYSITPSSPAILENIKG